MSHAISLYTPGLSFPVCAVHSLIRLNSFHSNRIKLYNIKLIKLILKVRATYQVGLNGKPVLSRRQLEQNRHYVKIEHHVSLFTIMRWCQTKPRTLNRPITQYVGSLLEEFAILLLIFLCV